MHCCLTDDLAEGKATCSRFKDIRVLFSSSLVRCLKGFFSSSLATSRNYLIQKILGAERGMTFWGLSV